MRRGEFWWSASFGRSCWKGVGRHGGRFEAVDRNGVLFGANLEKEGVRGTAEYLVRTGVGWG